MDEKEFEEGTFEFTDEEITDLSEQTGIEKRVLELVTKELSKDVEKEIEKIPYEEVESFGRTLLDFISKPKEVEEKPEAAEERAKKVDEIIERLKSLIHKHIKPTIEDILKRYEEMKPEWAAEVRALRAYSHIIGKIIVGRYLVGNRRTRKFLRLKLSDVPQYMHILTITNLYNPLNPTIISKNLAMPGLSFMMHDALLSLAVERKEEVEKLEELPFKYWRDIRNLFIKANEYIMTSPFAKIPWIVESLADVVSTAVKYIEREVEEDILKEKIKTIRKALREIEPKPKKISEIMPMLEEAKRFLEERHKDFVEKVGKKMPLNTVIRSIALAQGENVLTMFKNSIDTIYDALLHVQGIKIDKERFGELTSADIDIRSLSKYASFIKAFIDNIYSRLTDATMDTMQRKYGEEAYRIMKITDPKIADARLKSLFGNIYFDLYNYGTFADLMSRYSYLSESITFYSPLRKTIRASFEAVPIMPYEKAYRLWGTRIKKPLEALKRLEVIKFRIEKLMEKYLKEKGEKSGEMLGD